MGTYLEHSLKSSEGPEDWLNFFALIGAAFAHIEGTPAVPGFDDLTAEQIYILVVERAEELGIQDKLLAFSIATKHVQTDSKKGSYHLVVLDLDEKKVFIYTYTKAQVDDATEHYTEIEQEISQGKPLQAVLVSARSIRELRKGYPNYFLDTREFIKNLDKIEKMVDKPIKRGASNDIR